MTDPVAECLAGRLSPEVALARLVLAGHAPDAIAPLLPPGSPIAILFDRRRAGIDATAAMLRASAVDHRATGAAPAHAMAATRAMFDRAVAASPEASVAAYSLGDPELLGRATAEIVEWLRAGALVFPNSDVLDLGCGIGRVAAALAPEVRSVHGLDLSPGMIAAARARHAVPNLSFDVTDGTAATGFAAASLDLVLAVDSFPYLVQAGVADDHVAEAARVLRPGGTLAILNLSYRGDAGADAADARRWAERYGFALQLCGERPFRLWDGAAFVLRRL